MTGRRDLDRELTAYLEARSTNRAPDGLLEAALTRSDRTRQRPGWLILEHWLSPRSTGAAARLGNAALLLAILAFLVALALAIGVIVGSRQRLTPPFGPAKAGLITLDLAGDIVVANPDGTGRTNLTSGPDADIRPTFSPDGTLIAYESGLADGSWAVIVMNADGQHRVTLDGHLTDVGDLVWSPDSRRVRSGLGPSSRGLPISTSRMLTVGGRSSSARQTSSGKSRAGHRTASRSRSSGLTPAADPSRSLTACG